MVDSEEHRGDSSPRNVGTIIGAVIIISVFAVLGFSVLLSFI